MPEGPTLVLLRDAAARFRSQTVREATARGAFDASRMTGKRVVAVRTWGKHFLLEFRGFSLRVHLMLFGSYRIDDPKPAPAGLSLVFDDGRLDFYASSLRYIDGPLDDAYDWRGDIMSDAWDAAVVRRRLKQHPDLLVCDALLNQDLFAGVGNIIKNEVLFRIRVHPQSTVGALPARKQGEMVKQARVYGGEFFAWKRDDVLGDHLCVHAQSTCPACGGRVRQAVLGRTKRRAFYCANCQVRY